MAPLTCSDEQAPPAASSLRPFAASKGRAAQLAGHAALALGLAAAAGSPHSGTGAQRYSQLVDGADKHALQAIRLHREGDVASAVRPASCRRLYVIPPPRHVCGFTELYIVMEVCATVLQMPCREQLPLTPARVNTLLYNLLIGIRYLRTAPATLFEGALEDGPPRTAVPCSGGRLAVHLSGLRREPSLDAQTLDPTSAVVLRCRIGRAAWGSS